MAKSSGTTRSTGSKSTGATRTMSGSNLFLGTPTTPRIPAPASDRNVDNVVKWINGSDAAGSIRVQIDRAQEAFANNELTYEQAKRIVDAGQKRIDEIMRKQRR